MRGWHFFATGDIYFATGVIFFATGVIFFAQVPFFLHTSVCKINKIQTMREVWHVQIGQWGIQIGQQFWKKLLREHSIDSEGNFVGTDSEAIRYWNTYFNTTIDNKFVPRGLIIDTDSSTIESVQNSELKNLFSADNIIWAEYSPDGNKALVEYTYPSEIKSIICEWIRREAEAWDSLQSFQIVCALGGATGSSILNLILRYLREEYWNSIVETDVILTTRELNLKIKLNIKNY